MFRARLHRGRLTLLIVILAICFLLAAGQDTLQNVRAPGYTVVGCGYWGSQYEPDQSWRVRVSWSLPEMLNRSDLPKPTRQDGIICGYAPWLPSLPRNGTVAFP